MRMEWEVFGLSINSFVLEESGSAFWIRSSVLSTRTIPLSGWMSFHFREQISPILSPPYNASRMPAEKGSCA